MGQEKTYDTGVWMADRPDIGSSYSKGLFDNGSLYPLLTNTKGFGSTNWQGKNWGDGPENARYVGPDLKSTPFKNMREDFSSWASTDEAARAAREAGDKGIVIKNVVDTGPQSREELSKGTSIVSFDPTNIRSEFARFDPRLSHLAHLNASNASPEIGALTMAQILGEEEKARLPMSTFFPR
jgi:hypothetical protein